ncbi:carotenoid biosynthesis protein [Nocardia stercoris]|uniref:carotenoid biosynthesis protein n=1 Tax=Nocardia stercoris TaxID=2483361 RepID=UPI001F1FB1ED|nr:carotenoid biosynthesis protein [Nocardia stercoris]
MASVHGAVADRTRTMVPAVVAAGLWVPAQIAYPLTTGVARDRVTVVVVLLAAATALLHAWSVRGFRWAGAVFAILAGVGILAEIVGTATGYPFGCYDYAVGRLGPAVAGVPLVVPLAWTGGLYPVWVVARRLAGSMPGRIVVTAVGAVGWDLFLDPQMVADGQWHWCAAHSGLPGLAAIPWTNYLGWFAVALVLAGLLELAGRPDRGSRESLPDTVRRTQEAAPGPVRGTPETVPGPVRGTPETVPRQVRGTRETVPRPVHGTRDAGPRPVRGTRETVPGPVRGTADAGPVDGYRTRFDVPVVNETRDALPVAVFLWTWLGSTLAHAVFLGLPASAGYGFAGLGALGIPLLARIGCRRR